MKKINKLTIIFFLLYIYTMPVFSNISASPSIASGVVPHHILAKEIIIDFFEFISEQKQHPETIILLSPDHFNSAVLEPDISFLTVNWETGQKEICNIPVDIQLLEKLAIKQNIKQKSGAVLSDFGITNLLPFIGKYFPKTKVIPLLVPADISREEVESLAHNIHELSSPSTIMIASVDFSHYLPPEAAAFHDIKSRRVLLNFEQENFKNIEVDSWQSLYAARLFAKLRKSENPLIIAYQNSADFLPYDLNSTTSYFSVVFGQGKAVKDAKPETILFAGDMMLDRGMEKLMKQYGIYYPFQEITQLFRGVDIVFANLEGPVTQNILESPENHLNFSFQPKVLEGIKSNKINLVSLANNHMMDMGKKGFEETLELLEQYRINYVGSLISGNNKRIENLSCATEKTIFLAFNRILPFIHHQEEIIEEIKTASQNNPGKLIILSIHWGNEYQPTSSPAQRELAKKMVVAGADLIVGHHPHVVQEIELIEGKLVFYSLGNFIFDRQSIPETREGLLVGLSIEPHQISCRLFPIRNHSGQPVLMNQTETKLFLKNLVAKSAQRLSENIEKGIIEIKRTK